jgi:hypothetical protein
MSKGCISSHARNFFRIFSKWNDHVIRQPKSLWNYFKKKGEFYRGNSAKEVRDEKLFTLAD